MAVRPQTTRELFAKCRTREDGAKLYAVLLSNYGTNADWRYINQAVIDRWSVSGLEWVKNRAWQIRGNR